MKQVIFDASFFLSYLLPDENINQEIVSQFKEGKIKLIEPYIFSLEVTNALRYALGSQRISENKLFKIIKTFENLKNIEYVYDFDLEKIAKLALEKELSIYDACYLQLHLDTKYPLYTLDKKLIRAN
jgi:predicted nucleic acid-binding protein